MRIIEPFFFFNNYSLIFKKLAAQCYLPIMPFLIRFRLLKCMLLLLVFSFMVICVHSKTIRPAIDAGATGYYPFFTYRYNLNMGLAFQKDMTYLVSAGIGYSGTLTYNLKASVYFNKNKQRKFVPAFHVQGILNNYLKYNEIEPNPASNNLYHKHTIQTCFGLNYFHKKSNGYFQLSPGISYSFSKTNDEAFLLYPKIYNDKNVHFVLGLSITKIL